MGDNLTSPPTNQFALKIEKGVSSKITFLYSLLSLLLAFIGFWILTGIFSIPLILVLGGVLILSHLVHYLIGAIAGLTLSEKTKKVHVLLQMRAFEQGINQGLEGQGQLETWSLIIFILLSLLISLIGSLWAYWRYPIGDPQARVLIALFQFTLPTLFGMILQFALMWPAITSEFVDDDLRNFHLSAGFSNVLYLTIYLLFPLWIFKNDITQFFISLPPFWILLSIPLLLFLFVHVFPFFVGMYQFRHQARSMMEWQRDWLSETSQLLQLPEGEIQSQGLDDNFRKLEREREKHLKNSGLFQFFLYIATGRTSQPNAFSSAMRSNRGDPQSRALMNLLDIARQLEVKDQIDLSTLLVLEYDPGVAAERRLREAKRNMQISSYEPVIDAIWEHRADLVVWDLRFSHVFKLNELYERMKTFKSDDLKNFVKANLEDVDRRLSSFTNRKNVLAGSFISGLSAILIWLFKTFEEDISNTLSNLLNLN